MTSPLGPKVLPKPPPPQPEWVPHPNDKRFEVNSGNGTLRTKIMPPLPPKAIWPFGAP